MRRASYARPLLALVLFFAASAASLAFLNRSMPAYGAYAPTPTADIAGLCAARIAAGSDLQLNTYRGAPELFEHDGSDTCTLLDVPCRRRASALLRRRLRRRRLLLMRRSTGCGSARCAATACSR